jgi:hypothetical protein
MKELLILIIVLGLLVVAGSIVSAEGHGRVRPPSLVKSDSRRSPSSTTI